MHASLCPPSPPEEGRDCRAWRRDQTCLREVVRGVRRTQRRVMTSACVCLQCVIKLYREIRSPVMAACWVVCRMPLWSHGPLRRRRCTVKAQGWAAGAAQPWVCRVNPRANPGRGCTRVTGSSGGTLSEFGATGSITQGSQQKGREPWALMVKRPRRRLHFNAKRRDGLAL